MNRRAALALAFAAAALAACDRGAERVPADLPAFDAEAAHALLAEQVQFGPRYPGSPGHARQLEWMTAWLRERADTVLLQPFTHPTPQGEIRMTNVLARFRPDAADRILLVAHWDTRPTADMEADSADRAQPILGANDGASGVAVLLQLAQMMAMDAPPIGVDLLFVDGEDWAPGEMYLGSTYFARNLPPGYDPLYGIVVDMVADRNPVFPIEQYSQQYAPEVIARVWSTAEQLGLGHIFVRTPGQAIEDDHIPLNQAGIRTIDIIDLDYQYWHTLADDLSKTAPTGLDAVGRVLVALIYAGG